MTYPINKEAYEDCYNILDAALLSKNGIRYPESTWDKAVYLVNRLNYARKIDRLLSMRIHEPSNPRYGISGYDTLRIRRPKEIDGQWWIYIEQRKIDLGLLEEL